MRKARPIKVRLLGPVVPTREAIRILAVEYVKWWREKQAKGAHLEADASSSRDTGADAAPLQGDKDR